MTYFEDELDFFRIEEQKAQQFFFAYLALNQVPFDNPRALVAMNRGPLFWATAQHGMLMSAFIVLNRIFEVSSAHNVGTLLTQVGRDRIEFSHPALAGRKVAAGLSPTQAAEYVRDRHELTANHLRALRSAVQEQRQIWQTRYSKLRHLVFAHNGLRNGAEISDLYKSTDVGELLAMLGVLDALYLCLREAFHNGAEPVLRVTRLQMPPAGQDPRNPSSGERVFLEAREALMALCSDPIL